MHPADRALGPLAGRLVAWLGHPGRASAGLHRPRRVRGQVVAHRHAIPVPRPERRSHDSHARPPTDPHQARADRPRRPWQHRADRSGPDPPGDDDRPNPKLVGSHPRAGDVIPKEIAHDRSGRCRGPADGSSHRVTARLGRHVASIAPHPHRHHGILRRHGPARRLVAAPSHPSIAPLLAPPSVVPSRPGPTGRAERLNDSESPGQAKGPPLTGWPFRKNVRRRPALPQGPPCSTIGAERLSFRVRNGAGRFPLAMAAETLWRYGPDRISGTAQWTRKK